MKKIWWYCFDIGNSAHALLISTLGFSLYFKEYLYNSSPEGNSLWGAITSLILFTSAILSPLLTSFLVSKRHRALGLTLTTGICVIATWLLGTELSNGKILAIILYFISAVGYYLALPVYNTYLPDVKGKSIETTSGTGWGLGYLGGIISALICLKLGYLNLDVKTNPDIYKKIFIIAALFNLILSLPLMIFAFLKKEEDESPTSFNIKDMFNVFKHCTNSSILRILIIYWMIGEVAVVISYYFPIFLREYTVLATKDILEWFIYGQLIAIISTISLGYLSLKYGGKRMLIIVIVFWIIIPVLLFMVGMGLLPYYYSIIAISLVVGSFHAIIRGKIAEISTHITDSTDKGSLFGFLELSGRFSQVVGPLLMSFVTLFLPLNRAILFTSIFPIIALILTIKLSWSGKSES